MTGDREQIYNLARKSFLVAKEDPLGGENQMIHTENFVLIDKEKRIRGYYDGTKLEEMEKLLADIEILKSMKKFNNVVSYYYLFFLFCIK